MSVVPHSTKPTSETSIFQGERDFLFTFVSVSLVALCGVASYVTYASGTGQGHGLASQTIETAIDSKSKEMPAPPDSLTDEQKAHAAANAIIDAQINAQPKMTSIPIVQVGDLVDKVFGSYKNQDDLTTGELEWTLVPVSGRLELNGGSVVVTASQDATPSIDHQADGTPYTRVSLKSVNALSFSESAARLDSLDRYPAHFNSYHTVDAMLYGESAAVRKLHDGDTVVLVGVVLLTGPSSIKLQGAHVPPADEIQDDQVAVADPISSRDLMQPDSAYHNWHW